MLRLEQRRERLQLELMFARRNVMATPKLLEAACKGSHASQGTFQESMPVLCSSDVIRNCDYP